MALELLSSRIVSNNGQMISNMAPKQSIHNRIINPIRKIVKKVAKGVARTVSGFFKKRSSKYNAQNIPEPEMYTNQQPAYAPPNYGGYPPNYHHQQQQQQHGTYFHSWNISRSNAVASIEVLCRSV